MYHEVSTNNVCNKISHQMTPLYDVPAPLFENQIQLLAENGYKSLLFDDIEKLNKNSIGKCVIITFDDGLKGNYEHAFPILKKYGYCATFFVITGLIDSQRFMNWSQLSELENNGMSIQSHTVSHQSLQTLNKEQIHDELYESKQIIENKLSTTVHSVSFPHGSYNSEIVNIAEHLGFKWICTSDMRPTYYSSFLKRPITLGRFAITSKLNEKRLLALVGYSLFEIYKLSIPKLAKNTLKKILGINNYRRLYRRFFNIKV